MDSVTLVARYQLDVPRFEPNRLEQIAVAFSGSPRNGPDAGKVLLVNDAFSRQSFFYEFRVADIVYAEELPHLVKADGSAIAMVRLWVKKGATALKVEPFHVQDTHQRLAEFF